MTDGARFKRVLRAPHVLALSFGAMLGWSWVLLAGDWVAAARPLGTLIAYAAAGLVIACIGLTYAELVSADRGHREHGAGVPRS